MNTYLEPQLYIAGEWRRGEVGPAIFNPADEKAIGHVPMARRVDLDDAVMAAEDGFKIWRDWSPRARGELIQKAAALMRERIDDVAFAITLEHGKPLKQAQLEVIRGAEFYEWDAAEGQRTYGRVIPSEPGIKYTVHHQPIGPVAAFSPWNFPMS